MSDFGDWEKIDLANDCGSWDVINDTPVGGWDNNKCWILDTGFWRDSCSWRDLSFWKDAENLWSRVA